MRFDHIPERDRFIPGWHCRPEPIRAEQSRPDWRWPGSVRAAAQKFSGGPLVIWRILFSARRPASAPRPA
jgi:hypothetical protein